ncbi:hypothetical protein L332_06095 [Agrococcus pavilionensis RW1]|uniref:histidine kinase n=1 Tax=Agrococcus pavilionensis RW1 TaxID=1330458 RepID=U1MTN0_9MICO|nr:ATP-binding protein [Agrococcus pavilionensis]ERG64030.1 hypothetical protein L332_06095 [Agrococcus pavilionensis RW1]
MSHGAATSSSSAPKRGVIGVRARAALAATVIVAVALALGSAALVLLLQRSLSMSVEASVQDRVEEVVAALEAMPAATDSDALTRSLGSIAQTASRQGTVVQILAADGDVAGQSAEIEGEAALGRPVDPLDGIVWADARLPVDEEDAYRVARAGFAAPTGIYTVIVAQSLESVGESTAAVLPLLGIGYPILVLVVAASTYWLVGRSLRPVEAIRATVAAIGGRQLTERVPVPAAKDEIARLASTMNEMLARLESAQLSQRRFVADASHELRSPIATIKAMGETVVAHPDGALSATAAHAFVEEASRMERLVNGLLLLARADERGLSGERHDVDLDDLLAAERDRVRSTTSLTVESRIEAVRVSGSRSQLAQAIRNLVDNAVRHAHRSVALSVRAGDDAAIVEIGDDGEGIPAADRERVFDRFVRLDESRARDEGGTGLGLAIVTEIVRAHGGSVEVVDSRSGAQLRVTLPRRPA